MTLDRVANEMRREQARTLTWSCEQGRRALKTQVFILQDLKLSASAAPRDLIEGRIAKLLLLQDVLCTSKDLKQLPQRLRLCIEDGAHVVRDVCRALKTKVIPCLKPLPRMYTNVVKGPEPDSHRENTNQAGIKTPTLLAWYGAGSRSAGTNAEHELKVLKYAADRHMQEAILRRWQAATVGCYHARRCIQVAISVWVRDTPALSLRYKSLLKNTTDAKSKAIKTIFFAALQQPVNVRILAERRRFVRAQRFCRQVGKSHSKVGAIHL